MISTRTRANVAELVRLVTRADAWQNIATGIGTTRDKNTSTQFVWDARLDDQTIEALYHDDDMAARVCDELPDQMLRQGFSIVVDGDPEMGEQICDALDLLEAREKYVDGMTWGRAYGGSILFVGAIDNQDSSVPLAEDRIQSIDFLTVIDKREVVPNSWYLNPTEPKFGEVETYRVILTSSSNNVPIITNDVIHESRLIRFRGARTSIRQRRQNNGWDHSVLQRLYAVLQMFSMNWQSVAQLMADASQGVFKIKGLIDAIAEGEYGTVMKRLTMTDTMRSSARSVVVDSDGEDFTRIATPFGGIPELIDRTNTRLAAAAGMPVTVLFGDSPAGMNATGESDIRGWYDKVKNQQTHYLRPRLQRLITLLCLSKDGPTGGKIPEKWDIHFPSLWQMSPKEEAEVRYLVAQSDALYVTNQIVTPEEVATTRWTGPEGFSMGMNIDDDAREALMASDAIAAKLGKAEDPAADPEKQTEPTSGRPQKPADA